MEFAAEIIQQVWEKAEKVGGHNPNEWRLDDCGAWIGRSLYDTEDNDGGWRIDLILSVNKGGNSDLINLRPLHYLNLAAKRERDYYPKHGACYTAEQGLRLAGRNRIRIRQVPIPQKTQQLIKDTYHI